MPELAVLLYGRQVGTLVQDRNGKHTFEYCHDPGPVPLSTGLPLAGGPFPNRRVNAFLDGLLPDNPDVRLAEGRRLGVNGANPFALLSAIGLDCAGAVQFCAPADVDRVLSREGDLDPVSDEAIADRLARLRADSTESRVMPGESHSLAGWQGKFALHWTAAGQWCEALGSAPTTHILKPGVARLTLEALTEHVTMDTAARLGLPAAKTEYTEFAGQPAIVVERYDRARRPDGTVARVHQEDLCQGLGVPPHRKYERLGGPGLKDIFPFLRHTVGPEAEAGFARYLVFHYLSGSSDGHAKNCSIILGPQGERVLAPLYDAASVLYYAPAESQSPHGLAFSVGGEHVFGRVRDRHWRRMARACHVDPDLVFDPLRDLAARLPDAMRDAFRAAGPVAENMAREVMPLVQRLCHSAARDQPW